jgi:hypothetical protein
MLGCSTPTSQLIEPCSDIKAIRAGNDPALEDIDCEYIEYSTVPDQTGGPFWSILNRLFISRQTESPSHMVDHQKTEADFPVFECILLTLSEVGFPKRLFEELLPILGPAHGLGCLGVFQAL